MGRYFITTKTGPKGSFDDEKIRALVAAGMVPLTLRVRDADDGRVLTMGEICAPPADALAELDDALSDDAPCEDDLFIAEDEGYDDDLYIAGEDAPAPRPRTPAPHRFRAPSRRFGAARGRHGHGTREDSRYGGASRYHSYRRRGMPTGVVVTILVLFIGGFAGGAWYLYSYHLSQELLGRWLIDSERSMKSIMVAAGKRDPTLRQLGGAERVMMANMGAAMLGAMLKGLTIDVRDTTILLQFDASASLTGTQLSVDTLRYQSRDLGSGSYDLTVYSPDGEPKKARARVEGNSMVVTIDGAPLYFTRA